MSDTFTLNCPDDFEKLIDLLYKKSDFEVLMSPSNTRGYDTELQKDSKPTIAHIESDLPNNTHLENYSRDDFIWRYQRGKNIHIPPGKPPGRGNPPIDPPPGKPPRSDPPLQFSISLTFWQV